MSDIDDVGKFDVSWLDGEAGGQSKISLTYPAFNNTGSKPWGMECGIGRGVVGVFGFLSNNQAVLLTTLTSRIVGKGVGYDKTDEIKSGEFRTSSKFGAKVYLDGAGNLILSTTSTTILMNATNGKIEVTAPNGFYVNGAKLA
jgi:hypothetical protein